MTTAISIHPQFYQGSGGDKVCFETDEASRSNSNALKLTFSRPEYHDKNQDGVFMVDTQVTVFSLSNATADTLSMLGRMTEGQREKLVPIMEAMMRDEEAA